MQYLWVGSNKSNKNNKAKESRRLVRFGFHSKSQGPVGRFETVVKFGPR